MIISLQRFLCDTQPYEDILHEAPFRESGSQKIEPDKGGEKQPVKHDYPLLFEICFS
jgi:hypothetical protein